MQLYPAFICMIRVTIYQINVYSYVTWDFFIRVSAETLSSAFNSKLCSMPDDKIKIQ